jgi:hypothetical protein
MLNSCHHHFIQSGVKDMADEKVAEQLNATEQPNSTINPVGHGVPAPFVNRFHIWVDREVVRFVFGDSVSGEPPDSRMAIIMPRSLTVDFASVLTDLLKRAGPSYVEEKAES